MPFLRDHSCSSLKIFKNSFLSSDFPCAWAFKYYAYGDAERTIEPGLGTAKKLYQMPIAAYQINTQRPVTGKQEPLRFFLNFSENPPSD